MPCQTGIRTTVQCCCLAGLGWAGVGAHVEVCWATMTCRDLVRSALLPGRCGSYMEVGSGVLNGMNDVKGRDRTASWKRVASRNWELSTSWYAPVLLIKAKYISTFPLSRVVVWWRMKS